jgi:hypothetical protein
MNKTSHIMSKVCVIWTRFTIVKNVDQCANSNLHPMHKSKIRKGRRANIRKVSHLVASKEGRATL